MLTAAPFVPSRTHSTVTAGRNHRVISLSPAAPSAPSRMHYPVTAEGKRQVHRLSSAALPCPAKQCTFTAALSLRVVVSVSTTVATALRGCRSRLRLAWRSIGNVGGRFWAAWLSSWNVGRRFRRYWMLYISKRRNHTALPSLVGWGVFETLQNLLVVVVRIVTMS